MLHQVYIILLSGPNGVQVSVAGVGGRGGGPHVGGLCPDRGQHVLLLLPPQLRHLCHRVRLPPLHDCWW